MKQNLLVILLCVIGVTLLGIASSRFVADGDNNFLLAFSDSPTDVIDSNTRDIVAGSDLDGDGKLEIIVTDYDNGGQTHVFEVVGDNTIDSVWSSPGTPSFETFAAREVKTADLDHDGLGEIVLSISKNNAPADSSGLYVYEWDGVTDNGYNLVAVIPVDSGLVTGFTEDFAVDDIDGDGITEVVFLNNGTDPEDNVYVFSITGTFETSWSMVTEAVFTRTGGDFNGGVYDVVVGNMDGDAFKEIIVSVTEDSGAFFIAEASGPDTYVPSNYVLIDTVDTGFSLEGMALADFDNNGADELYVALFPSNQLVVMTGGTDVSTITFANNVRVLRTGGVGPLGLTIGDQDHGAGSDGPDIYVSQFGNPDDGGYIQDFEFTGTDIFDPASYTEHVIFQDVAISTPAGFFQLDAPAVDLDGDGNRELLLSYTGDNPGGIHMRILEFNPLSPSLTLSSPNGGEVWDFGSTQTISWSAQNFIGGLRLEYSTDGGAGWNEIVSYTANDGSYDWQIPNDPSTDALVRVSKMAVGTPSDESDAAFTLTGLQTAEITFIIDDSQFQELTDCLLMGSWDANGFYDPSWSSGEQQMYDDGTNGDAVAGDHLWTLQLNLVVDFGANVWNWGAVDSPGGSWLIEGANQEFTLPDTSPQTLTYVREGYETPCTGVSWTLDDLVANSGGIVTGTFPDYVTQQTIVVCANDELTIPAGSTLKFEKGELRVDGTLIVAGDSANVVTFTSNAATPAPDDWGTLHFRPGSGGEIKYAHVEYSHNGLWCDGGGPSQVLRSTFTDMNNDGLLIVNFSPGTFEYNQISNSGWSGIALINSSATFRHNTITLAGQNGFYVSGSSNTSIDSNIVSSSNFDGIHVVNASPNITYNLIYGNNDEGIDCSNASPNIMNNTIHNNGLVPIPAGSNSSGIESGESSFPIIKNNIVTENAHYGISCYSGSVAQISYNNVWGHVLDEYLDCGPGQGDISVDPLYVNAGLSDFNLQSGSPCIDAGDPASPFDPDGTIADMGALYFDQSATWLVPVTVQAISSPQPLPEVSQFARAFGGHPNATDGFDQGLDVVAGPPAFDYYAYFAIAALPNFLETDYRGWLAPFEADIDWTLLVINAIGITSEMSWSPDSLPAEGSFRLKEPTLGIDVDMRQQSSVQFTGNASLFIEYRPEVCVEFDFPVANGAWYLVSLPVTPEDNALASLFPDAIAAFEWDFASSNYVSADSLDPGRAYWLLLLQAATVEVCGLPFESYTSNYSQQGWDMIGAVLDTNEVIDDPDGSVIAMFGWDAVAQNYFAVDPLIADPQLGYWILVFGAPSSISLGSGSSPVSSIAAKTGGDVQADLAAFYQLYGTQPPAPPSSVSSDLSSEISVPTEFGLSQNYPNPFNPSTMITYQLPVSSRVTVSIYDVLGREISILVAAVQSAGEHRVMWDGRNAGGQRVKSGVYFVRMRAGDFVQIRKLVLVK